VVESPEEPADQVEEPGESSEEPTELPEEPGAGAPEVPDSLAGVAGEYRLVEASAREAMGSVVVEYQWAEGVLVVDTDGVVSGEVTFWYRDWEGQDCRTDEPKVCFLNQVEFGGTVVAAQLEEAGGGFAYADTMVVAVRVTERNHPELGLLPPITREMEMPVTGVVDLDAGTISLSQGESGSGEIIFRR
jgi:hypothetical protein